MAQVIFYVCLIVQDPPQCCLTETVIKSIMYGLISNQSHGSENIHSKN